MLKQQPDFDVELSQGPRGSFEVRVHDTIVARRGWFGIPSDKRILGAIRALLGKPT